jgi:malate dehydrogenase (oxaloacetate-decarboxylating)
MRDGLRFKVDQTNNSYIFPGVGLGALAVGASRITDGMFMAAAKALASSSPARDNPRHNLLPPVSALRGVAAKVALAVAIQAHNEGYAADIPVDQIDQCIRAKIWTPRYVPYRRQTETAS